MRNGKERNYRSFGYLIEMKKGCSEEEKARQCRKAEAMNAVLLMGDENETEREEKIKEAERRCRQVELKRVFKLRCESCIWMSMFSQNSA